MTTQIIYNVIWEDRHMDVRVFSFMKKENAIIWAKKQVKENAKNESDIFEELTSLMKKAGWLYHGIYSSEGDNIRVVETEFNI